MAHQHLQHKTCKNCGLKIERSTFVSKNSFARAKYCSIECRQVFANLRNLSWRSKRRRLLQKKKKRRERSKHYSGLQNMINERVQCSNGECKRVSTTIFNGGWFCSKHFKDLKNSLVWDWNDNKYVKKPRHTKRRK